MQAVSVVVAGDVAEFVAFGGDFSVGVVAVFAGGTAWQGQTSQPTHSVPLILGQRAMFIFARHLAAQVVVAIAPDATIGQLLLNQLPALIPHQAMAAVVRVPDAGQLPMFVVAVVGNVTVGIDATGDIALVIALVFPDRYTPAHHAYETVVMLVGSGLIFAGKQRHQASGLVVLVGRHRAQRILLDRQPAFSVVGFEVLRAIGIDALHQSRTVVVDIDFLAAIGVVHRDLAVIAPHIARVHLREAGPVPHTARRLAGAFPRPEETRPTGQAALNNDVLLVVAVHLALADGIGRRDQSAQVVIGVGNDVLLSRPDIRTTAFGALNLVVHRDNAPSPIAQKQRATHPVIHPLDTSEHIAENSQVVLIRIADRCQHTVAKVVEPRCLGQHQLIRRSAQIDRRFGQAIGDCRPRNGGHWKRDRAIFMVGPHHRIA